MILARNNEQQANGARMLVTGGGAFNTFLVKRISELLQPLDLQTIVADDRLANYKEALIMAFLGGAALARGIYRVVFGYWCP